MSLPVPLALVIIASFLSASLASPLDLKASCLLGDDILKHLSRRADPVQTSVAHRGHPSAAGPYVYTVFSLLFLIIMGVLFGKRLEHLKITRRQDIQPIRILVFCIYFVAIIMILGLSIMLQAQGLHSPVGCSAGIVVCLVGYVGTKVLLYLFLIERLHAFNYRQPRLKDKAWIGSVAFVFAGYGAVAATAFAFPFSDYSEETGTCSIGLSTGTLIALLIYDLATNIGLTSLFVRCLLVPLRFRYQHSSEQSGSMAHRLSELTSNGSPETSGPSSSPAPGTARGVVDAKSTQNIERLLIKSLSGLLMLMIPTIINLALLLAFSGHEPGWLCFTLCLADVTAQIAVVHWMTRTPLDLASKIRLAAPGRPSFEQRKASNDDSTAMPPAYHPTDPLASASL